MKFSDYKLLASIDQPADLKKLSVGELPQVAQELRNYILDIVATKEGHLGASLGVVELTLALHYVFNTPDDLLVWDVGHQAYGHKIITQRKSQFHTNRQWNGISGFPKRAESIFDAFGVGHSSTSISAILGMALASKLNGNTEKQHIAVIGDASIAAGMAFEGLNHAGVSNTNVLIILNDNAIGIDPSVGALKEYLTNVKEGKNHRENNMIKSLNFNYFGPVDGHDVEELVKILNKLKTISGPKFLHIITTKGKGLEQAEKDQVLYHAPGKFNRITGEIIPKNDTHLPPKFQDVFGHTLVELAKENPKIVGITPAMPSGSSLKYMMEAFPERAFDVGIAEQHAVTLAAGMATQDLVVFCTIYSTFIQRAYDQIIHDVALQNLPVIFCIDRAGLVGEDGATHQGVFDIAFLRCIPSLIICAPRTAQDLRNLMFTAQLGLSNPIAIRYPRGRALETDWQKPFEKIEIGKAEKLKIGNKFAILSAGFIGNQVIEALKEVSNPDDFAHYNFLFIKPLDEATLHEICKKYVKIMTLEEATVKGGFGSSIAEFITANDYTISLKILGIPDTFIEHGTVLQQYEFCGLDVKNLIKVFDSI
uniref:1-deoxy-D-xylulose-5-phosphate synthase n=1 Tax=Flavobacterium sp. TaxID=239 RepID=UPI00404B0B4D